MNYKLGREQHGQYKRTKKTKTVETQTAVQKEQKHPATVTTIKLCLKPFLITKCRLV